MCTLGVRLRPLQLLTYIKLLKASTERKNNSSLRSVSKSSAKLLRRVKETELHPSIEVRCDLLSMSACHLMKL